MTFHMMNFWLTTRHAATSDMCSTRRLLIYENNDRILKKKSNYRIIPKKRTPFYFMIANYRELKEKYEVSKEINAK